jgi:hypothetical protein
VSTHYRVGKNGRIKSNTWVFPPPTIYGRRINLFSMLGKWLKMRMQTITRDGRWSAKRKPVGLISLLGCLGTTTLLGATAPSAIADPGEIRPGCGTYCQSAGQYGAAGAPPPSPVTILSTGTITVEPDGYVPVTLKCNAQVQCQGALMLELSGWSNPQGMSWVTGRSDLVVNAGATQTIGVPLPAAAIAFLRSNGPTLLHVTADAGPTNPSTGYQLAGAHLTLAAPG